MGVVAGEEGCHGGLRYAILDSSAPLGACPSGLSPASKDGPPKAVPVPRFRLTVRPELTPLRSPLLQHKSMPHQPILAETIHRQRWLPECARMVRACQCVDTVSLAYHWQCPLAVLLWGLGALCCRCLQRPQWCISTLIVHQFQAVDNNNNHSLVTLSRAQSHDSFHHLLLSSLCATVNKFWSHRKVWVKRISEKSPISLLLGPCPKTTRRASRPTSFLQANPQPEPLPESTSSSCKLPTIEAN